MTDLITTKQVAELYGVDQRSVRYAVKHGRFGEVQKLGWQHVFDKNKLPKKWPVRGRAKNGSKTLL